MHVWFYSTEIKRFFKNFYYGGNGNNTTWNTFEKLFFFFYILTAVDFYSVMVYLASLCYSWDMFPFPISHLILSKHVLLIWQFCTINVADRKSQKNLLQYIWPSWNTHLLPIPSRPSFEHLIYVSEEPGNGRYEAMRKKTLSLARQWHAAPTPRYTTSCLLCMWKKDSLPFRKANFK